MKVERKYRLWKGYHIVILSNLFIVAVTHLHAYVLCNGYKMRMLKITLTFLIIMVLSGACSVKDKQTTAGTDTTNTEVSVVKDTQDNTESNEQQTDLITPAAENTFLYPAYESISGDKKYGYIDHTGNFVIKPVYSDAANFSEGLAIVFDSKKYHVIDTKGTSIYESEYAVKPFHNGAAAFSGMINDNYLYGYIDTKGKVLIEPKYTYAGPFKDEKAFVSSKDGKYDLIDKKGTVLESYTIAKKYRNIVSFENGFIIYTAEDTNYQGVITYQGKEVIKPEYGEILYLGNDLFSVKEPDAELYYYPALPAAIMNKDGKLLSGFHYYDLTQYSGGYSSATDDDNTFFVDTNGKVADSLPKINGRGNLTFLEDVIKGEIDGDLLYMTKDGTIFWQNDRTKELTPGITVKATKFKPNKYVVVYYPTVTGLSDHKAEDKINTALKKLFTDHRAQLKKEDYTSVEDTFDAQLNKDLFTINKTGYDYPFGAAHGMPVNDYYFFDTKTGRQYALKDLFKKDSNYVKKISAIIKDMIKEQGTNSDSMLFTDSFKGIAKDQYFKLTGNSLILYFYPYDIAAYAAGFPEFKISFDKLNDILNKDGSFWKAFH